MVTLRRSISHSPFSPASLDVAHPGLLFRDHLHSHSHLGLLAQLLFISIVWTLCYSGRAFQHPSPSCPLPSAYPLCTALKPQQKPPGRAHFPRLLQLREPPLRGGVGLCARRLRGTALRYVDRHFTTGWGLLCGCQLSPRSELVATQRVAAVTAAAEK